MSPAASPTIPKIKPKPIKTRRKAQFKLRFHHQALPPEYLDHYEASQLSLQRKEQQQLQQQAKTVKSNGTGGSSTKNKSQQNQTMDENNQQQRNKNESVRSWLQKITEAQQREQKTKDEGAGQAAASAAVVSKPPPKVVSYKDLPYMGEMTLANSKPRRGRKPKKADICHLIYKNYGTVFPDRPKDPEDEEKTPKKLENEPLNLCVRDAGETAFPISSSDDEESSILSSRATTPLLSAADFATDSNLASNLRMSLPNFQTALTEAPPSPTGTPPSTVDSEQLSPSSGLVSFLPTPGVFMHPSMALYYQKMVGGMGSKLTDSDQPLNDGIKVEPRLVPKNINKLLKEREFPSPPPQAGPSSEDSHSSSSKRATPTPGKRKRSAIFIPPVPMEPKSHATEVSICKFKFTGGAKPSLQEKKMLSVDSGGNFRYYSGTGDKSMRGYEFFPRESLAQSSLTASTTTSAFLNATSEKIDLPPPSQGLSNELLQIPEFPSTSSLPIVPIPSPIGRSTSHQLHQIPQHHLPHHHHHLTLAEKKKRKSRRSVQREKLEKTFKEKGFLIQTQQRQSAEGATYCKFRQLKKFTRYLFRSWKDHLPSTELQGQLLDPNMAAVSLQQDQHHDLTMSSSASRTPDLS